MRYVFYNVLKICKAISLNHSPLNQQQTLYGARANVYIVHSSKNNCAMRGAAHLKFLISTNRRRFNYEMCAMVKRST